MKKSKKAEAQQQKKQDNRLQEEETLQAKKPEQTADSRSREAEPEGQEKETEEERAYREARMKRRAKRQKELKKEKRIKAAIALLLLAGIGFGGYELAQSGKINIGAMQSADAGKKDEVSVKEDSKEENQVQEAQTEASEKETKQTEKETETEEVNSQEQDDKLAEADHMAMQYDYDGAIALLNAQDGYAENAAYQEAVSRYETEKAACVEISPDTVEHVFVHSLIVDPARAFDGDNAQDGYNKNMVTLDEFKKIIQSMYDNGYVLVSLHDMGEVDENGKMHRTSIYLPEGKKPIVFSQDDVSYYHTYENDGFATRLLIDEDGKVKNEYTDAQGVTTIGDYDMVPVIDSFIEEHPDFSYRGRKGIVVLTGYNGVLGYHTDLDYKEKLHLQENQKLWLDQHPEFDYEADIAEATKVAEAMKANGWEFANHTWGHIAVGDNSVDYIREDTEKWLSRVAPIVGDTDLIIFAFGSDIGDWTGYAADNPKFQYLKSVGFNYYCNVDGSSLCWVQFGDEYLRQGRMDIDGYRMATNPDVFAPLFNVSEVYDTSRPAMPAW